MATFIKQVEPIEVRKNAVIEFTPHELDVLAHILCRIGGSVKKDRPHEVAENILKVLRQAGAERQDFPLANMPYHKSIYYAMDDDE